MPLLAADRYSAMKGKLFAFAHVTQLSFTASIVRRISDLLDNLKG